MPPIWMMGRSLYHESPSEVPPQFDAECIMTDMVDTFHSEWPALGPAQHLVVLILIPY